MIETFVPTTTIVLATGLFRLGFSRMKHTHNPKQFVNNSSVSRVALSHYNGSEGRRQETLSRVPVGGPPPSPPSITSPSDTVV